MDPKEIQALIDKAIKAAAPETAPVDVGVAVAAAMKADRESQAAIEKARVETEAANKKLVDEAVAVENKKMKAEFAKANRLPWNEEKGEVNVAKYSDLWKYDDLGVGDQAFMVGLLQEAHRVGHSRGGATESAMKALAIKIVEDKTPETNAAKHAMKMLGMPMKTNDLNQSTLANYGDEWVGQTYSRDLWEKIRLQANVAARIPSVVVPQGSESIIIPVDGAAPTFYKVAQATAQDSNPGPITRTVTTSKKGTAQKTLSVVKMGASTYYTGELEEDSLIPWAAELRSDMQKEGAEVLDSICIDGDTELSITTNINDIAGTPAGTESFLLFDGFRKSALVTTTANSRDGGAFEINDFLETLKLMGIAGKNAVDIKMTAFIVDLWTHWKALELAQVLTQDVFANPTIKEGKLIEVFGREIIASANMHRANQDATYGLKANSAGKLDLNTPANNTKGAILGVRWDQWRLGFKRMMTFETVRVPSADATEITALMRVGMIQRDTEASAISYNLSI